MKAKKRKLKKEVKNLIILFIIISLVLIGLICSNQRYSLNLSYPKELRALYENNHEARNFVLAYHDEKDKAHDISLQEYKYSTEVPLFLQWDVRWGFSDYGGECVAVSGCGPLCLSMVGYHLTKNEELFSPDNVIEFAKKERYCLRSNGTSWTLMTEGAAKLGLYSEVLPLDESIIISALEDGKPIILIMGPGKFTSTGHFIVLCSYKNGKFTINDPNSIINSEKRWSYDEFCNEIMNIWAFSNIKKQNEAIIK